MSQLRKWFLPDGGNKLHTVVSQQKSNMDYMTYKMACGLETWENDYLDFTHFPNNRFDKCKNCLKQIKKGATTLGCGCE